MNDEQLAGVLTYIRQSFGNQASAVHGPDVAKVRSETASRVGAWTEAELEKAERSP